MARRVSTRTVSGFSSQIFASAANVLILFACAQRMTPAEFGELAVVVAFVTAATVGSRGIFGTMLSVTANRPVALFREANYALPAATALGLTLSLLSILVGIVLDVHYWYAIAISFPLILTQDIMRFALTAMGKSLFAAVSDGIRFIFSGSLYVCVLLGVELSGEALLMLWGGGSAVGLLVVWKSSQVTPHFNGIIKWIGEDVKERGAFAFDSTLLGITTITYVALLALSIGPEELASIRGAGTLLGPFNTLASGVAMVIVPQLVQSGGTPKSMLRQLVPLSFALVALALIMGSLGLWLPASAGALLLGATWAGASIVLPIMGLEYALQGIRSVLVNILRASRASLWITVNRVVSTIGIISVALVVPQFGGFIMVAWAMVVNAGLGCIVMVVAVMRLKPNPEHGHPPNGFEG